MTQDYQDVITSILNALGQDSMSQIMSRVSYQIMESPNGNFAEVEAGTLFNALYNQDGEIIVRVPPNLEGVRLMIIMAHEFYHLYLFNITRTTLPNQLHLVNFKLNEFLNTSSTVNDGHHNYMGYSSNVYELFLRSAFPGQDNDFYTKGKWGGIV